MKLSNPPKHPNAFEHSEQPIKFIGFVVLYGVIGSILGRVIDKTISKVQGETHTKIEMSLFFVAQMTLNALIIYIGFRTLRLNTLFLDDWLSSTFQGVLFVTMCFSVQDNFYANARLII